MTTVRCPTCHQPVKAAPRICYDCKVPISRHHKWTYQEREGILTVVHRHCNHPTMLLLPSEYRRQCGDAMADRMGVPKKDAPMPVILGRGGAPTTEHGINRGDENAHSL